MVTIKTYGLTIYYKLTIDCFRLFIPGYGPFTGIKNIKLNKMLFVTYITLFDKYDRPYYIVIEPIDFEGDLI